VPERRGMQRWPHCRSGLSGAPSLLSNATEGRTREVAMSMIERPNLRLPPLPAPTARSTQVLRPPAVDRLLPGGASHHQPPARVLSANSLAGLLAAPRSSVLAVALEGRAIEGALCSCGPPRTRGSPACRPLTPGAAEGGRSLACVRGAMEALAKPGISFH